MAKEQVAGAIILDTLRDRLVSGLYVGYWRAGERLPSIREIADAEGVDRKTAAAAYHRLEEEGLVEVRPRSGVYLCAPPRPSTPGPLERLHRQWLQHTFEGARALGLDTHAMLRLIHGVADLEQLRLPVVECNWSQAEAIAEELRERLAVQAMPYLLEELRPGDPVLAEAPVLVTTPYHGSELSLLAPGRIVLEANLAPEVLREIQSRMVRERIVVVTGNDLLAAKVSRALEHMRPTREHAPPPRTISAADRSALYAAAREADFLLLWPGTPGWVEEAAPEGVPRLRPRRCIADESLSRIHVALLDEALRRAREASRSTGAVAPR